MRRFSQAPSGSGVIRAYEDKAVRFWEIAFSENGLEENHDENRFRKEKDTRMKNRAPNAKKRRGKERHGTAPKKIPRGAFSRRRGFPLREARAKPKLIRLAHLHGQHLVRGRMRPDDFQPATRRREHSRARSHPRKREEQHENGKKDGQKSFFHLQKKARNAHVPQL